LTLTLILLLPYFFLFSEAYCDPLGNENIFASLRPIKPNNTHPVIVVAARVCDSEHSKYNV